MTACNCSERYEPIKAAIPGSNVPGRLWRVYARRCHFSAFNGGHLEYSEYSGVCCMRCGRHWRTKAKYVDFLTDQHLSESWVLPGVEDYELVMESWGRTPYTGPENGL